MLAPVERSAGAFLLERAMAKDDRMPMSPHGQAFYRNKERQKQADRVWNFVGDEINLPGEGRILSKGNKDERLVRRVDTGEEFVTRRRFIEGVPDVDEEGGGDEVEGSQG